MFLIMVAKISRFICERISFVLCNSFFFTSIDKRKYKQECCSKKKKAFFPCIQGICGQNASDKKILFGNFDIGPYIWKRRQKSTEKPLAVKTNGRIIKVNIKDSLANANGGRPRQNQSEYL